MTFKFTMFSYMINLTIIYGDTVNKRLNAKLKNLDIKSINSTYKHNNKIEKYQFHFSFGYTNQNHFFFLRFIFI